MMRWNDTEVRLTHLPTGITTRANGHRSQHRNRDSAYQQLRGKLYAGTPEMELVASYTMPEGEPWPDDIGQHRRNLK